MSELRRVATLEEIPERKGFAVDVEGRRIALFKVDGEVRAIEARCARHDAPLEKGAVDEDHLHCPWHGVTFDLDTGICSAFPEEQSGTTYPVEIRDEEVWVRL